MEKKKKTKYKEAKGFQKEINTITLSSSLPSPGFFHEWTSLCRTGPQFCPLVCSVTSAWYCAPEQEEFAVTSWTLSMDDTRYSTCGWHNFHQLSQGLVWN